MKTNLNASVKKVSFDGRISVPSELTAHFDLSKPIYVMLEDNSICLTQKAKKTSKQTQVSTIFANSNGAIQFRTSRYFPSGSSVAMYRRNDKKDTLTITCL